MFRKTVVMAVFILVAVVMAGCAGPEASPTVVVEKIVEEMDVVENEKLLEAPSLELPADGDTLFWTTGDAYWTWKYALPRGWRYHLRVWSSSGQLVIDKMTIQEALREWWPDVSDNYCWAVVVVDSSGAPVSFQSPKWCFRYIRPFWVGKVSTPRPTRIPVPPEYLE